MAKLNNMRGYSCIGLAQPKSPNNVGSVLRIAGNYNVSMVAYTGDRYKKSPLDTMKQYKFRPLLRVENLHEIIPYDCVPVAIELKENAKPLTTYKHPERAFYIFGQEDGSISKEILSWCKDIVYVPTNRCMNLAVTVGVVLYDRLLKSEVNNGWQI